MHFGGISGRLIHQPSNSGHEAALSGSQGDGVICISDIGSITVPECTAVRVPLIVAGAPRQHRVERLEQEVQSPGDDDVVVDADDRRDDNHSVAYTWWGDDKT